MTWQRVLRVGGTMLLAGLSAFGAATLVVGVDLRRVRRAFAIRQRFPSSPSSSLASADRRRSKASTLRVSGGRARRTHADFFGFSGMRAKARSPASMRAPNAVLPLFAHRIMPCATRSRTSC